MINKADFDTMLYGIILRYFPNSRLAYIEERDEWLDDLFEGKTDIYIEKHSSQAKASQADLQFIAEATSVVVLFKMVVDTYIAIKNELDRTKELDRKPHEEKKMINEAALRADLTERLSKYVPETSVSNVVDDIVRSTSALN